MKKLKVCLIVGLLAVSGTCFAADDSAGAAQSDYEKMYGTATQKGTESTPEVKQGGWMHMDIQMKYHQRSREGKIYNPTTNAQKQSVQFDKDEERSDWSFEVWYYDKPNKTTVYVFDRRGWLVDNYIVRKTHYVAVKERAPYVAVKAPN